MLNATEQRNILRRFPRFELSYDERIHKKVYTNSDIFMAVPYGAKYMAWITYYQTYEVCFLLELYPNKKVKTMTPIVSCFHDDLAVGQGTVLFGTVVKNKFFVIESVPCYCGRIKDTKDTVQQHGVLLDMFRENVKQVSFTKNDMVFSLPLMNERYDGLLKMIDGLPYEIYGIRFINKNYGNGRLFIHKQPKTTHEAIFKVQAVVQNDIYNIFYYSHKTKQHVQHHKHLLIPGFKTSVMMNSIFRTMKENVRLDALEESDDEDEFENVDECKFVDLEKQIFMKCIFNQKFRKWMPVEIVGKNENPRAINSDALETIENKYIKNNRR